MGVNLERMRSIKLFAISIIIMVGFPGIVTIFLPAKVTVSKSILINATETQVAREIETFKNWKNWCPAFQNQNIVITTLQKSDSSFVTVTDEKGRKLSMAMVQSGPENIDVILFSKNVNKLTWQFILSTSRTGQTQLTWNVNTTLCWYPWRKIAGIFLDKVTGPQYQAALQNLKIAVEMHQESSRK